MGVPWWHPDAPPVVAHNHHRPVVVVASSYAAGRAWCEAHDSAAGQVVTEPTYLHGWPPDAVYVLVRDPADDAATWLRMLAALAQSELTPRDGAAA